MTLVKRFEDLDLPLFTVEPDNVAEVLGTIELLGLVTHQEPQASELVRELEARLEEIKRTVSKTEKRPRVYFGSWDPPYYTCGPGNFQQEMIELAGGTNIARDAISRWPQYSLEKIIEHDPEVIIQGLSGDRQTDISAVIAHLQESPGWRHVTAAKQGRVYILDEDLTHRPGPRIIDGIEAIARVLHPQLFDETVK